MDPEFSMNDDDGVDSDSDGSLDPSKIFRQKSYTIMKEEDIRRRLEGEITEIATVLSVSRVAACTLLRRYNWSVTAVHEAWFADEEGVRKAVGLTEKPANSAGLPRDQSVSCLICFESYPLDKLEDRPD
ncbi:hypothetical protein RJ639_036835 [Escallonia herrerae]|uniref:E3 ubiquitin-protein ligase ARIH1-like UBA-like domain-containing protein n=1 Tax=Escallonia herrerae TaxID=1293975 RepID=A0AA89B7K0_9ASTE|nr:hypothetical protein RJ639_036835 [Escallonia herrerae]